MEEDVKNVGFPSDFLSPEKKAQKEYSLRWAQAVNKIGINGVNNGLFPGMNGVGQNALNKMIEWRNYARGAQPIDKYKPILGVDDKRKRNDPNAISYKALNWEILDIASKYVNLLLGKLMKQNNDIGVMAVDKRAQDARRQKLMEMQEYVLNQQFLQGVSEKTGIGFETPLHDDVTDAPTDIAGVNMYMKHFYKEDYCEIVQDLLKIMNEQDNYTDILAEFGRDLIEVAVGATKVYRVGRKVKRRRCVPERMVMSSTNKSLCDDVRFIGEYWDLTISQFKEIAGSQFTEEEYRKIAEQATRTTFDMVNVDNYYNQNLCYPWDNTKITVLDLVWFSNDWETYQEGVNRFGNRTITQKEYSWWQNLEKKGVTVESFNKVNESKVIRYPLSNQYQCLWVIGTDFVCNYGKSKDMLKNQSSLGTCIGPYTIYKLKKCPIETIIPILDDTQINWLQCQHHAAKSVPPGFDIDISALEGISLDGAGGTRTKPKDVLRIYFETGIMLRKSINAQGYNSQNKPVNPLAGGVSDAFEKHWAKIVNNIDFLRTQLGLNELTDGSTPNSEMGKAVAEMASGSTNDALKPIFFAFDTVNLETQKRSVMCISGMAATGLAPEYTEALGIGPMSILALLSDLTQAELGVYLMRQPTQEMRLWINEYAKAGIANGSLYEEEAMEIQMEPNIWKAIKLLKMYRKQKQQQKQAEVQQQYDAEQQKNIASAQAAEQAKQQTLQMENQSKESLIQQQAKVDFALEQQRVQNEAFLLSVKNKLEKDKELSVEEQRRLTELLKAETVGEYQLQAAREKPKPTSK